MEGANHPRSGGPKGALSLGLLARSRQKAPLDLLGGKRGAPVSTYEMSLSTASILVGEPLIQEINSDGTSAMPELFSRPLTSLPPDNSEHAPQSCRILCQLCRMLDKFQTVSFNSWKFAGSQARINKEF